MKYSSADPEELLRGQVRARRKVVTIIPEVTQGDAIIWVIED
jgi:hypothetical protein